MFGRVKPIVAITALLLGGGGAVAGVATAVPGPGTFTTLTTPSHDIIYKWQGPPAVNHLVVSGKTSHDVTFVDIVCVTLEHTHPTTMTLAAGVPVNNRSFDVIATIGDFPVTCRLRAVPSGVDPETDYLGSYSGPLLRAYTSVKTRDTGKTVGFQAVDEIGSGAAIVADAGQCGVTLIVTILIPQAEARGPVTPACSFQLPAGNLTGTGTSNASSVRVDGKNAYSPFNVSDFLRGDLALALPPSAMTTTFTRHSNGDVTVTETSPLRRCDGDNTYPPTSVSCTTLVGTGVSYKRVYNIIRGCHQVEMRDSYISTDGHQHNVSAQYGFMASSGDAGAPGYIYPHHPNKFSTAKLDKVVTGFGSGPASVLVRSDIYALSTDDQADTVGLTWSRPPAKIQFSHTSTSLFAMPYSFHVAAHGTASVQFAESQALLTTDARKLAAKAVADF